MSLVEYREAQLEFEKAVDECLHVFVRGGTATGPNRQLMLIRLP
jgi:hypothetical protein